MPPSGRCRARRLGRFGAAMAGTAIAGAVEHFQRAMMMDIDQAAKAMRDAEMEAEIEDFLDGFSQPTWRGMRIDGGGCRSGQASTAGAGCSYRRRPYLTTSYAV